MEHEVATHLAGGVRDSFRMISVRTGEKKPRRSHAVTGNHDDVGMLGMDLAALICPFDPLCCVAGHQDPRDGSTGDQLCSGRESTRPVGVVGRRSRTGEAPHFAGSAAVAGWPSVVLRCQDLTVSGPPVPTESVQRRGDPPASTAQRYRRRLPGRARRISRITVSTRHPYDTIVDLVIGGEIPVGEGPVSTHTIEAAHGTVAREPTTGWCYHPPR